MRGLLADIWTGWRTAPGRAALAFCPLVLGLAAVTVLLATLEALQRRAERLEGTFGADVFMLAPVEEGTWTRRQVEVLAGALAGVAEVSGERLAGIRDGVDVWAVDGRWAWVRRRGVAEGRALDELDVRGRTRCAMATRAAAVESTPGEWLEVEREGFRLVGRLEGEGVVVAIPWTCGAFPGEGGDGREALERVDQVWVRAVPGSTPEIARRRTASAMAAAGWGEARWTTPETLLAGIRGWQRAIGWTAGVGGGLALILGGVTLAGLLLSGVRERVAEIGLRRALGARQWEVAALFVAEGLALAGGASAVGMALAALALRLPWVVYPLPFHFGWTTCLVPPAVALVLALLCSAGPALLAARMPPAEALRND